MSLTVSSNFPGSSINPGAKTVITAGENIRINKDAAVKTTKKMLNRLVVNFHAAASPFWVSVSVKTGMKAAVTAPSPKILRCILGIRKATKNASADADDPNAMAITISRRNPKSLDNRVIPPTAPAALLTFLLLSIKGVGSGGNY